MTAYTGSSAKRAQKKDLTINKAQIYNGHNLR